MVRLIVPADVRPLLGQSVFKIRTGETDEHRAVAKAGPIIAALKYRIGTARASLVKPIEAKAEDLAEAYRARQSTDPPSAQAFVLSDVIAFVLRQQGHSWMEYGRQVREAGYDSHSDLRMLPHGQMDHTYPSLKFPEYQQALSEATNHGAIQVIDTDELGCPLRVKLPGSHIDDTTGGNSGVKPRLSAMYTQMMTERAYALEHLAGMVSSNAAKIMSMYPRKDALAVDSDADIVGARHWHREIHSCRRPA
jgi:hypothetical protein